MNLTFDFSQKADPEKEKERKISKAEAELYNPPFIEWHNRPQCIECGIRMIPCRRWGTNPKNVAYYCPRCADNPRDKEDRK